MVSLLLFYGFSPLNITTEKSYWKLNVHENEWEKRMRRSRRNVEAMK